MSPQDASLPDLGDLPTFLVPRRLKLAEFLVSNCAKRHRLDQRTILRDQLRFMRSGESPMGDTPICYSVDKIRMSGDIRQWE
jgi:hypothetical protein